MTRMQALAAAIFGSLLGVFSTLLPWASTAGVSLAGHQVGDGKVHLALSLGALILLGVSLMRPGKALPALAFWLGLAGTALAVYDIVDIQHIAAISDPLETGRSVGVGAGLYLAVIGSALQAISSGIAYWTTAQEASYGPYVLLTFLRKPYSRRDAFNRLLVLAAIAAAIVAPIFLGRGGGDATEGASGDFAARLAELEEARAQRDEQGGSDELDARIAQLETETQLGYLKRDGDASDRGALAPDFRLLDLEGNPHRLSEISGPIVLNFWASWCEPCIEEMPEFELVSQETAGRVTFIGVNDGEDLATAREFAYDVTGVSYLVLLDPTKSMTDGPYPLVGRPTTFFIGADGIIKQLRVGIVDLETLRALVGELLGEELGAVEQDAAPSDYGEAARNLIESAQANYASAAELIGRYRAAAEVLADPGWQRSMEAQTRAWSDLAEQIAALTPPERWSDLHERVADAMAQIANAAGPLVRDAVEAESAAIMNTAATLFDSFRGQFDQAAENLEGVIETQQ